MQVVDCPLPRTCTATLTTNYGGVAAVAVPGVRLCNIDLGIKADTFELLCVRVSSGSSACVVTVIYRTGPISQLFFTELSDVLDRVTTYVDPVYLVGDVNICIDRPADPSTRQFTELLTAHGLVCCVTTPTHDRGGLLDVVAAQHQANRRRHRRCLSDHLLLR